MIVALDAKRQIEMKTGRSRILRLWPRRALSEVEEVRDDEDREDRGLGDDEAGHPDLAAVRQIHRSGGAGKARRYAHSYFQSGSSGCFRSHSGRRLLTIGIVSKLYAGGGDVVAHSSVQASHGSSPAGRPLRSDRTC